MSSNKTVGQDSYKKISTSLAVKISVTGFLLSLFVALIVGFSFYFYSKQIVTGQEVNRFRFNEGVVESLLSNFLGTIESEVRFLSKTDAIKGYIKAKEDNDVVEQQRHIAQLEVTVSDFLKSKNIFNKINFIEGKESYNIISGFKAVNDVISITKEYDVSDFQILQKILSLSRDQVYFSDINVTLPFESSSAITKQTLNVGIPIYSNRNHILFGLVDIEINFDNFIEYLNDNIPNDVLLYLATAKGELIYYPESEIAHKNNHYIQQQFPQVSNLIANNIYSAGIYDLPSDKEHKRVGYYSVFTSNHWFDFKSLHLLIQNNSKDYLLAIENMRQRTLLIGGGLAILSLLISILFSKRIIKPLISMSKSVRHYEKTGEIGNLPVHETDEIGTLARSFKHLLKNIDKQSALQREAVLTSIEYSARLQAILNSIADAVINIDQYGTIIAFNRSAETMFGYEVDEVLGKKINMLMPHEYSQKHDDYITNYLNSGESKIIGEGRELVAIRKNGEKFFMHLSITQIDSAQGISFTGLIKDITSQKLMEEERKNILSKTKEIAWKLDFALSAPGIGVWDQNITTGETYWDERMYRLFGFDLDMSQSPKDIWQKAVHPDDVEAVTNNIINSIKEGRDLSHVYRVILPNKNIRVLEAHARILRDEKNNKLRMVGTNQDITEQHHLQEIKQEALNLAEVSLKLKSEFLASMSHEIRTPMNGVLGMLSLLEQSKLSKQQAHYVELASSSGQYLLILINDILDFSKIEAGKLELDIVDFDLLKELGDFSESMAVRAQEKGLELILDVAGINQSMVKGDPTRLRQILSNLVGNAIKFTATGEVVLKATLKEHSEHLQFNCEIIDTGIGIADEKISTLFESFTQVDATTTRKYGGTGLGLAIVKQLCELMGGSVKVSSILNQGSNFKFSLYFDKSEQAKFVIPQVDIKEVEILIVDDNETNLETLKEQLETWGAIVTQASDGLAAIDAINKRNENNFKIAILDMQMPGMDGATLGKMIHEHANSHKTKLIMMTSMDEQRDAAYFTHLGFAAYFPKPATTSDLFDALATVLGTNNISDESLNTEHHIQSLALTATDRILPKNARILLVEDNRINQAVILGVLTNMGINADVAGNGIEAIDALKSSSVDTPYQLIIMDCQMPEMDGYQATKEIRAGRANDIYINIPIIAMTANAMKGDKEICLSAGMSDYATKPVDADSLKEKLLFWIGLAGTENEKILIPETIDDVETINHPLEVTDNKDIPIWDKAGFYKRIRNNIKLADKITQMFIEEMPEVLEQLQQAIVEEKNSDICALAHKLKGSVKNLGGASLALVAEEIEQKTKEQKTNDLSALKSRLTHEFDQFITALQQG